MSDFEKLIDINELADMLGVSRDTAYKYAREGSIPTLRIGRTWRFSPQAVREQMAAPRDLWAYPERSKARRRKAS
jgi:excisionase family DNA binding protein